MKFDFKFDTKEDLENSLKILTGNINEIPKSTQYEIIDNVFDACDRLSIGYEWVRENLLEVKSIATNIVGGKDIMTEEEKKELLDSISKSISNRDTATQEISDLKAKLEKVITDLADKDKVISEKDQLLQASQNTVKKLTDEKEEIVKAKESVEKELNTIKVEASYQRRLSMLTEAGVNLEKFGKEEKDRKEFIQGLTDDVFDKTLELVKSSKKEAPPVEPDKKPKTDLVEASEKTPEIVTNNDDDPVIDRAAVIIQGLKNRNIFRSRA